MKRVFFLFLSVPLRFFVCCSADARKEKEASDEIDELYINGGRANIGCDILRIGYSSL
jgi:hypothetical protein